MLEGLLDFFKDKSVIILGFGKEGISTYNFIRKYFPEKRIQVADKNEKLIEINPYLKDDKYTELNIGEDYFKDIDRYDIIMKTPGISFKDVDYSKFKDKIFNQLELIFRYISCYKIGITGTKGKTTTSSIIYKTLIDQGKKALLLGNIGEPYFNDLDKMEEDTILVLELSSHALEFVSHSPDIAILLDIFQEHLDHHNYIEEYIAAKYNIQKFQSNKDYFIYNCTNKYMVDFAEKNGIKPKKNDIAIIGNIDKLDKDDSKKVKEEIINGHYENFIYCKGSKIFYNDGVIYNKKIKTKLKGDHNYCNLLFVFAVAKILNLDIEKMVKSMEEFEPIQHRLEFVEEKNGITYYNDSIATIPEATIAAVKALKEVDTLIVGGTDRKVDLTEFCKFLRRNKKIRNIICMPKTGEYIYDSLKDVKKNLYMVSDVKEAAILGSKITEVGKICLMSPAAASYGYYKNFEDRGKQFKEAVKNL